ncbi:putative calcium-transporting ATPase 13, plasma membrane-type [Neltuma alba]|uniref:putative calcium-transporting ATPase 13, plasma membrane-type n=1 Tax=Neltuma alba TaxID=207710 RepID=UPI0010A43627|nr:putative calcium-transporting ATPase 13, plasma membrane-type [Prosopis alba]
MSKAFLPDMETIQTLLHAPKNLSKPNKKWRSAFVSIYCYRALLSHFKSTLLPSRTTIKNKPNLSPSSSYTVIDLDTDYSFFSVSQTTLTNLVKEKNEETLQNLGGVHGVVSALKTDIENGVKGGGDDDDPSDVMRRRDAFGSNTYPKPPTRGFFHFVSEGFKDPTILILLVCAALSLGFGIKENGIKEGWYEGGSIFVAVFLVIAVSSISNFRQSRQFDKLSQVSNNIQVDVVRSGRRWLAPGRPFSAS